MSIKFGKDKGVAFLTLPCGTTYQITAEEARKLLLRKGVVQE